MNCSTNKRKKELILGIIARQLSELCVLYNYLAFDVTLNRLLLKVNKQLEDENIHIYKSDVIRFIGNNYTFTVKISKP